MSKTILSLTVQRRSLLLLVLVLGIILRFWIPVTQGDYTTRPFQLGGLYAYWAQLIAENGWRLPTYFEGYSFQMIPFVYPPLGAYIWGVAHTLFGIPYIALSVFSGATFASLGLLAFYYMSKVILKDLWSATLATVAYALIPNVTLYLIPGGNFVSSAGILFFLLAIAFALRAFRATKLSWPLLLGAGLCMGFGGMSSPASAQGLIVTLPLLIIQARTHQALKRGMIIIAVSVLVASPWWASILFHHGISAFLWPVGALYNNTFEQDVTFMEMINRLLVFNMFREQYLTIWGLLTLFGILIALARRQVWIVVWLFILYFTPRHFIMLYPIPAALLAGIGIRRVFLPIVRSISWNLLKNGYLRKNLLTRQLIYTLAMTLLVLYGFLSTVILLERNPYSWIKQFTPSDVEAIEWIKRATPDDARFVVIGFQEEWIPSLTRRTVVSTYYGAEVIGNTQAFEVHRGILHCTTEQCMDKIAAKYGFQYDYVYVTRDEIRQRTENAPVLAAALTQSANFDVAFDNGGTVIFQRKSPG